MKGTNPTADQKRFWDALARHVGCIACRKDGVFNDHVSIHHIDGRNKPGAHWLVLPLCFSHHQGRICESGAIPVHPYKARFETKYGKQIDLLEECRQLLVDAGFDGPMGD